MHRDVVEPIFWGVKWADPNCRRQDQRDAVVLRRRRWLPLRGDQTEYTDEVAGPQGRYARTDSLRLLGGRPQRQPNAADPRRGVRNDLQPVSNGYYPVYIQPRGHANSAWHSAGTCPRPRSSSRSSSISTATPAATWDSPDRPHRASRRMANVSGHELSGGADRPPLRRPVRRGRGELRQVRVDVRHAALTFTNGSLWKIQGNWSNAAFNAGIGYRERKRTERLPRRQLVV